MSRIPDISIIIPVYNSSAIFPELMKQLKKVLETRTKQYEIVAVADGCVDDSAELIANHSRKDSRIKLIELSRNFGHQAAITAGLKHCKGKMAAIIDDDLEDPPEVILRLMDKAEQGYDVVYAIRKKRKVTWIRQISYFCFYRLLNRMTDIEIPQDAGDFCLMRRPVIDELNSMPESNRYVRGMRSWLGFRQTGVSYERGSRHEGKSGYSFSKYLRLALDAVLSFSYKPLKTVSTAGFLIASISFVVGLVTIMQKLLGKMPNVPGWTSLMVIVLFLGGIQLISIGILGQYIARIYDETKQRPVYVIKRTVGIDRGERE